VIDLVCPGDRATLQQGGDALVCPSCKKIYPIDCGVVRFMGAQDDFYEGLFNNEIRYLPRGNGLLHRLPLWLITNGYLWEVTRSIRQGARVLELGCAGGIAWFGKQFDVVGVDVSHESLRIAAQKYGTCIQAKDLNAISDGSIDAVISSYFWEHMTKSDKAAILDQITRILQPGGKIIFVYDVATKNPLISWMRKTRPQLYRAMFIDSDGHLGYQTVEENDALFRAHGFHITCSHPMERTPLQSTSVYLKMLHWPGIAHWIGRSLSILDRPPFLHLYTALLRLVDGTVGRLFPRSWGRITILVAEKR
jgi:SAM-dependent methyltransferase